MAHVRNVKSVTTPTLFLPDSSEPVPRTLYAKTLFGRIFQLSRPIQKPSAYELGVAVTLNNKWLC